MSDASPIHLFQAFGVELEYMLVGRDSLEVLPVADKLLAAQAGELAGDAEGLERIDWSNELVLHVLEFKTAGPAPALSGLAGAFGRNVARASELAAPLGARLMPGAAHPWMDPHTQTRLWPHEYSEVYQTYDRIFGCKGHGWSNLQSMHINLPFSGDNEFGRLHAAIRLLLPVMPALTASSPLLDSRPTGWLDSRMEVYCHNSERLPAVAGQIVPEAAFSEAEYESRIYQPMLAQIAPFDPAGILKKEFLNSRGAIARFDRGSIEIRVLDLQECPPADLAAAALICAVLKKLSMEDWIDPEAQKRWEVEPLATLFREVIRDGHAARIADRGYLALFGLNPDRPVTALEFWNHLAALCLPGFEHDPAWEKPLEVLLRRGCLSGRILAALDGDCRRERLKEVYLELCRCLDHGAMFLP
ncbi:glutamate--cysteine ligase [bacterium]|nr:glutamate--cysteine ligase [bacterium]